MPVDEAVAIEVELLDQDQVGRAHLPFGRKGTRASALVRAGAVAMGCAAGRERVSGNGGSLELRRVESRRSCSPREGVSSSFVLPARPRFCPSLDMYTTALAGA
jgi:hypothetical protein